MRRESVMGGLVAYKAVTLNQMAPSTTNADPVTLKVGKNGG